MLHFLWYSEGENVGNNEVCIIGILEYHVLVNRVQIRSIKDVSYWVHARSLNNACSNRHKLRSTAFSLSMVLTIGLEVYNPVIDIKKWFAIS